MRKSRSSLRERGRRCLQVGDQIKEELSFLMSSSLKDPRLPRLTITEVVLSPDFLSARVFFVPFGSSLEGEKRDEVCALLNTTSGFLRKKLYKILKIKNVPALSFFYDELFDQSSRVCFLIDQALSSSSA